MRSFLFVPGDSEKKLGKAMGTGADALIVDMEDSVALSRKDAAREITPAFVAENRGKGVALYVRVNAFDTGMIYRDLAAVMAAKPDGIMLPKAVGQGDIDTLSIALSALEAREGTEEGTTRIFSVATETAEAVLSLGQKIVHPRLAAMTWGAEDLSASLSAQVKHGADGQYLAPFLHARNMCLFASRASGVLPVDSVYPDTRDLAGLEAETIAGRDIGFGAKCAIHPAQIEVINRVYTPTEEQLAWARKIKAAFDAEPDAGVLNLDGQMIDRPHLRLAERLLLLAP
ncbi:MAG: CoA ester lyase [Alphaproteobacteria bacterium]|nr:CoA ester lyase [Alphaproteobacteria bacterium]MDX5370120.1 CoA ester lyase [Alphaproteobacteria bacterium]MDX5464682.1 CoA ester lyase [Alphaproteobacteria bacterium]